MGFTALERVFSPSRVQAKGRVPLFLEHPVETTDAPFLSSRPNGQFVEVPRSQHTGVARFAFFSTDLENQDKVIFMALIDFLRTWPQTKVVKSFQDISTAFSPDLEARSFVISEHDLPSIMEGQDLSRAREQIKKFGYILINETIQVLVADIPPKKSLVFTAPALAGLYCRTSDHVAVMVLGANRSVVLIDQS